MFGESLCSMGSRVSCVKDTLLIIDGHSMAFRAFYALPAQGFRTATGQHTNAVYGFVSMLVKLLETERPTRVAVAFDVSRHSFRTEEYPEYKGTREETPEEFKGQVELIQQVLDAMGITSLSKEGFEADDVLATLARRGAERGWDVLVVSGDRDTLQTVNDRVTVLYPGATPGDLRRMTPEAVEDRYGVPPHRYPEIAALVGETSDNLPGVPGVGPKTAAQWINKFDGLDNLLERAAEVPGKRGEALREHIEDVRRNRRLNHLLTDMEVGVDIDDLHRRPTDRAAMNEVFDALEINNLRKRVMAVASIAVPGIEEGGAALVDGQGVAGGAEDNGFDEDDALGITVATEAEQISAWAAAQAGAGDEPVALRVEGEKAPFRGRVDRLVLSSRSAALVVEEPATLTAPAQGALWALVSGAKDLTIADWKGSWHACASLGWDLPAPAFDVRLGAYVAHPELRSYDTVDLASRYLGLHLGEDEGAALGALFELGEVGEGGGNNGPTAAQARSARLSRALFDLRAKVEAELSEAGSLKVLIEMEQPVSACLARMEHVGIGADGREFDEQSEALGKDVEAARREAFAVIGREVNLSSPKQLQEVLFDELGLPKTKKTKTGYTTNAEALQDLLVRTAHWTENAGRDFLVHLLAHRDRIKLKQMVDTVRATVATDGRIHSTFSQTVAATGRLASSDPNLQNIPARTPDGLRIRKAFVAGEGFESLMSADYSQIEMRIMAHLSEDAGLIEAFKSGADLHRQMASMVFGVPVEDVTSEQRSRIKATSYGLAYGLSRFGLSAQLRIPVPEAQALMDRYFERFGGVREYLAFVVEEARAQGWTETMFGRRRYLPDLRSDNRQRREMAERAALNAPIQGTAADIIKIAMIELDRLLAQTDLKSRMLVQIHDELLLEIAPGETEQVEALVRQAMASPVQMDVPLEVVVGVGGNWMEAAH